MSLCIATPVTASSQRDHHASAPTRSYFFLTGQASSELLPRILNPFAKLGLTPYRIHASNENGAGEEMSIELRFTGMDAAMTENLAARCRSVIGIRSVIVSSSE